MKQLSKSQIKIFEYLKECSENGRVPSVREICKKKGMDLPIYVSYFRKKDLTYIFDAPVLYSELSKNGASKEEICKRLVERCNELGKMQFEAPMSELNAEESEKETSVV